MFAGLKSDPDNALRYSSQVNWIESSASERLEIEEIESRASINKDDVFVIKPLILSAVSTTLKPTVLLSIKPSWASSVNSVTDKDTLLKSEPNETSLFTLIEEAADLLRKFT